MSNDHRANTKNVLIIEDEPILGKICARILASDGYTVALALNGSIAKSMVQNGNYDICLSDIRTPEVNGIELYKYLKEKHPLLAEKTIFMTGDITSMKVKSFLEDDRIRFIVKPFSPGELKLAISELTK